MSKLIGRLSARLKSLHLRPASDIRSHKYSYQPFSESRNIRLLTLHDGDGPICISLTEAALDSSTYVALSYTWGSPIEQIDNGPASQVARFIQCNDQPLQVTENLYQALLQFRADGETGPLWIDAICINQDDLTERSSQVRMMGDIYAKSRNVLVWLGIADTETEEAISLVTDLSNAVDQLEGEISSWGNFFFNDPKFYEQVGLEHLSIAQWEIIVRLLARKWFRRLWVLQEVVLGKPTKAVIGHFDLPFDALIVTVSFLAWSGWAVTLKRLKLYPSIEDTQGPLKAQTDIGVLLLHTALGLGSCNGDGPEYPGTRRHLERIYGARNADERLYAYLLDIVERSRVFDSQDPTDHIFAPLSLISRLASSRQQTVDWIIPDYTLSTSSVFISASTLFTKKLPILSLLSHGEDLAKRQQAGLPSWVPDFSRPKSIIPMAYISNYDIHDSLDPFDDRAKRFDKLNRLHVSGSIRGIVNKVSESIEEIYLRHTFDTLLELASMLPEAGPNGQGRVEVLWRTLVGDSFRALDDVERNFPAPTELENSFYNNFRYQMAVALVNSRTKAVEDIAFWNDHIMYEKFAMENRLPSRLEIQQEADAVDLAMKQAEDASGPFFMNPEYSYAILDFQSEMQVPIAGRSLLVTDLGDLGLGPLSTRNGDVIAYIRNAKVPIILRKTRTGNFEVIGDAYIHGFMRGEILKEGPIQFEDIILE